MKHKSPKKLRRSKTIGVWIFAGPLTFSDTKSDPIIFYQGGETTVTLPSGTFDGFQVGDVITIDGQYKAKKKKKVHVARRRQREKLIRHIVTEVGGTTMTIKADESVTVTKITDSGWLVAGENIS